MNRLPAPIHALPVLTPGAPGVTNDVEAVQPLPGGIAMAAAVEPDVDCHVRRANRSGPTRGLSLPLATVTLDPAPSRPGGPRAATGGEVLLRLGLWLADVAAEAALAATAGASRRTGRAEEPPFGKSAS